MLLAGSRGKYFGQQLDDWRQNSELYSKKADYDYHHAMAQHAAVVSAAGGGQLHPAMAQLPMLPTGLNLSMGSAANMAANMAAAAGLQMSQLTASANSTSSSSASGGGGGGGGGSAAALHHHHHHHHQHLQHQHGNAPAAHQQALHHQHQHHHHVGYMGHMGTGAAVVGPGGKLKHKKPKVNKDGVPAPKRATTAYITFTQWYREEMKKSGRQIPRIGDFGKECAGKWNTMSDEDKQPFLSAAARDRERYKREMAVYKPARDVNKPKRPGTAFMLFMADFRKEMAGKEPEGGVAALAKLGGERWRGMTEDDKRPYVERQNEEKMKYETNMEEYRRKQQTAETQAAKLQQAAAAAAAQAAEDQGGGGRNDQHDNGGDSDSGEDTFHGNQTHSNPPSGGSTPSPGGGGATTHSEHTDESQGAPATPSSQGGSAAAAAAAAAAASERGNNASGGGLPSLASPLSLAHPLASLGYQHSLASFGITSGGFGGGPHAAHTVASTASAPYLPGSAATYSQAHLPGPYSWT